MSEKDDHLRQRLREKYKPEMLAKNCLKKKGFSSETEMCTAAYFTLLCIGNKNIGINKLIHLFASGFPCQPYSAIGKKKGEKDKRAAVGRAAPNTQFSM